MAEKSSCSATLFRWMGNESSCKVVVLIVGEPEELKHRLAVALLKLKTSVKIDVHVVKKLPLVDRGVERPNIDCIICMVDITNRASNKAFEESVQHIDFQYFSGRVVFVVMNAKLVSQHSFEICALSELEQVYGCPVFYADMISSPALELVANKLIKFAEYAAGLWSSITPGFLRIV